MMSYITCPTLDQITHYSKQFSKSINIYLDTNYQSLIKIVYFIDSAILDNGCCKIASAKIYSLFLNETTIIVLVSQVLQVVSLSISYFKNTFCIA